MISVRLGTLKNLRLLEIGQTQACGGGGGGRVENRFWEHPELW